MTTQKVTNEVVKLVESACRKKTNFYGCSIWTHHIVYVVKYAKLLAKKLKADQEVVELAALLHDYAAISNKNLSSQHHLHGAKLAEEILKKYHFPQKKIEEIKKCILTHRASQNLLPQTLEAKIIASADAMAHFDNIDSLLHLAYVQHKLGIDEGTKWVLAKLERSWQKLMPEAKQLLEKKYEAIKIALS